MNIKSVKKEIKKKLINPMLPYSLFGFGVSSRQKLQINECVIKILPSLRGFSCPQTKLKVPFKY